MATTRNVVELILLELVCYVPIAIILGNVLPPIGPLKIHWIYIGVIFLVTLTSLIKHRSAHTLLLLICVFGIIQAVVAVRFSVQHFIDFISGPLLFVAVANVCISDKIRVQQLKRYRRKMLIGFSIPIIIAFLQMLKIAPLEFLNATYVNLTVYGSEILERVNGFLFHGIELAIIIFFFFVTLGILRSYLSMYFLLAAMIFFEYISIIKSGILAAIAFAGYYAYFIDHRFRTVKLMVFAAILAFGLSYVYVLIPDLQEQRLTFDEATLQFQDQLFTGRGFIWNTYLRGIKDFTAAQVVFGAGFGSAPVVFTSNVIGSVAHRQWAPGPHNQLLELFVNGGIFAIWLVGTILIGQYRKLSAFFHTDKVNFRKYYVGIILVPIFTMGITAPIMSMYVYWCGLSAVILSMRIKFDRINL